MTERAATGPALARAGLLGLLVLAACVRLYGIEAHGPWWDELLSISSACGSRLSAPIGAGPTFTARDFWQGNTLPGVVDAVVHQDGGNAILYHVLLHGWLRATSTADLDARLPSAVCGVLAVWLVHRLSRVLFAPRVAWWAAGFLAVHPLLVRYGQEARSYALATLLSLAATLVFVRIWTDETRGVEKWSSALAYGLLTAAALLSHYLTIGVFTGHALFALLRVRRKATWACLLGAAAVAASLVAVWLGGEGRRGFAEMAATNQTYDQRARALAPGENFALPTTPRNLLAGGLQVTYAMSGNALQNTGLRLGQMIPMLLLPAAFLLAGGRGRGPEDAPSGPLLLAILASSGLVVSAGLALLSGHVIAFQPHYASFATPYLVILMAAGMARAVEGAGPAAWAGRTLVAAQMVVIALSLKAVYDDAPRFRPPNPFAAMAAAAVEEPAAAMVFPTVQEARIVNLYLPADHPAGQRVDPAAGDAVWILRPGRERQRLPRPPL